MKPPEAPVPHIVCVYRFGRRRVTLLLRLLSPLAHHGNR